jgi:putative ABC transport system permease protein
MFKNYFKIALRHLFRQKTFSLINISGLAIGFACTALIFLWVTDELNFDDFHKNKNQIYRVLVNATGINIDRTVAVTPGKLAEAIKNEIQEVKYVTRNNKNFRTPFK